MKTGAVRYRFKRIPRGAQLRWQLDQRPTEAVLTCALGLQTLCTRLFRLILLACPIKCHISFRSDEMCVLGRFWNPAADVYRTKVDGR
jgi:hypothetical protein